MIYKNFFPNILVVLSALGFSNSFASGSLASCLGPSVDDHCLGQPAAEPGCSREARVRHSKQALATDVAIIGSGPAGLQAAVYCAGAGYKTIVVTGPHIGGQLAESHMVENWPGSAPRPGMDIMNDFVAQVERLGARLVYESVDHVNFFERPFEVWTDADTCIRAKSVIIATGAKPRMLGVPGEQQYWGKGVSSCAVCDCFCYVDRDVVVVGGGDAAVDQALQLASYARHVTILARSTALRAQEFMKEKLKANADKISVLFQRSIRAIEGDGSKVTAVILENRASGAATEERLAIDGVFLAIGHVPNTELFANVLSRDAAGYLRTGAQTRDGFKFAESGGCATQIPGVFVAGEATDSQYCQASYEIGLGAKAGMCAVDFIRYAADSTAELTNLVQ